MIRLTSKAMKTRKCPGCGDRGQLRHVIYGLPSGPPDEGASVLGGCTVFGNDRDVRCISCGWEGWKTNFPSAKEVAEGTWNTSLTN